jgi:gas vesicle protein
MSERTNDLLTGMLIGGLIGAALGILFAPKSGKETREDIARKTDELLTKAKEEYEAAVEKSKRLYETAVQRAQGKVCDVEETVAGLAEKGKEAFLDNKNRFKKAIDAGIDAFKEEKGETS